MELIWEIVPQAEERNIFMMVQVNFCIYQAHHIHTIASDPILK